MTTYDIIADPEHYYLVQFSLDTNGYMQPIGAAPFQTFTSTRYPTLPFVSPKASKFGLRRLKGATHWAVVYDDGTNTVVLHYGTLESLKRKKRIIPFDHGTDHYLILRGSPAYFKAIVAREHSPANITALTQKVS